MLKPCAAQSKGKPCVGHILWTTLVSQLQIDKVVSNKQTTGRQKYDFLISFQMIEKWYQTPFSLHRKKKEILMLALITLKKNKTISLCGDFFFNDLIIQINGSQSMDPGPPAAESPTDLLERQILRDHQRSCKILTNENCFIGILHQKNFKLSQNLRYSYQHLDIH